VLEDARERGFDSAEMLDKGFGFMIALIPSLLQRLGAGMPTRHFGMLARLYHLHTIEHALRRVRTMDDEWYWENIHYVNEELERARAIRPR
jgi:hypothetical protein